MAFNQRHKGESPVSRRNLFFIGMIGLPSAIPAVAQESPPPAMPASPLVSPEQPLPPAPSGQSGPSTTGTGMGGKGVGMGGMGMGMGGGPGGGGPGGGNGMPGYGATWYPGRTTSTGEDLGLVRQHLSIGLPVWKEDGDMLMLNTSVRHTEFFTNARLPDSGRPFPPELWNVSFGAMYSHQFDNGWTGGLMGNFGSASDKPFHSLREMNIGGIGFLRVPAMRDGDSWMFMLMYSPVGNLNFPIPGVAYSWNPNEQWHINVGIPFSVTWRPNEDWSFNITYMPVTNVNAKVNYRADQAVLLYGGFEWLNEAYFLAGRENRKDRFLGFEKRLVGGVRWNLFEHAGLDFQAGYAFDRFYGIGQNLIGNARDRVNVASGAFVGLNLFLKF